MITKQQTPSPSPPTYVEEAGSSKPGTSAEVPTPVFSRRPVPIPPIQPPPIHSETIVPSSFLYSRNQLSSASLAAGWVGLFPSERTGPLTMLTVNLVLCEMSDEEENGVFSAENADDVPPLETAENSKQVVAAVSSARAIVVCTQPAHVQE